MAGWSRLLKIYYLIGCVRAWPQATGCYPCIWPPVLCLFDLLLYAGFTLYSQYFMPSITESIHCNNTIWVLCCLMIPGLSEDIQCHVWPCSFSKLVNHQISDHLHIGQPAWWLQVATLLFLKRPHWYVWIHMLTLTPLRGDFWQSHQEPENQWISFTKSLLARLAT